MFEMQQPYGAEKMLNVGYEVTIDILSLRSKCEEQSLNSSLLVRYVCSVARAGYHVVCQMQ